MVNNRGCGCFSVTGGTIQHCKQPSNRHHLYVYTGLLFSSAATMASTTSLPKNLYFKLVHAFYKELQN